MAIRKASKKVDLSFRKIGKPIVAQRNKFSTFDPYSPLKVGSNPHSQGTPSPGLKNRPAR